MTYGDNLDVQGLQKDAKYLLDRAENGMMSYLRIASSDDYKRGNREVAKMRAEEFKKEADTLRRLIELAFTPAIA